MCSAGDLGLIPGSGRFPGEGHGNPLQYSCLKDFMDRGARQGVVHDFIKSDMTEQLTLTDKNIYSPNCYCLIVSFIVQNIIHKFVYS